MSKLYVKCPVCSDDGNKFPELDVCPGCSGQRFIESGLTECQFDTYRRKLAEGTNYFVDDQQRPHKVWFRSGRTVTLVDAVTDKQPHLRVEWDGPSRPLYLIEGLNSSPLDQNSTEPRAVYRVFTEACGSKFAAWKHQSGVTSRLGESTGEVGEAYEAILRDLGFYCPVYYREDEDDGCPTPAQFGLPAS